MNPHEFQRAGLAYSATDVAAVAGRPGSEAATLAHWLRISGRHWYKPLAMRGYAAPWFFLHDAGILALWGQSAIRPHASALGWSAAQQVAYDDYATYLGRLARIPLLDSVRRWLHDLSAELRERGHSDEARAHAELQVMLATLEWLLDTIEPAIGWRRLATDLRWQGGQDADAAQLDPVGEDEVKAANNLRNGLTPDGENPPERPFTNFLRQVIGTGDLLWKPASSADSIRRRWFSEIAIRAATDFREAIRTARGRDLVMSVYGTPLARIVPEAPLRTRALRPLDTALIERYLNRTRPAPDQEIQMELDYARQEQIVDIDNPMRTFPEGLSGIMRRGPINAMIKRELIDDDLFYAKFADNSLLYHSRPELLGVPYRFFMGILVDASLNAALPDGTSARSLAKELALYLLDTARLIPKVAPGLPTDGYLFQFGNQGAAYQRAQMPDVDARYARLGLAPILSPGLDALPGEFLLNLNDPPDDLNDPWLLRSDVLAASYFNLTTIPARELPPISAWDATGVVYPVQPPHTWEIGTPTRQASHMTGQLTVLSGDAGLLSIKPLGGALPDQPSGPVEQQVTVMRGQPMAIDIDLPAGSTFRVALDATGYLPVGYRLNLRFSPGARGLHIGPHVWPAVARLAQVAAQQLAARDLPAEQQVAYSLAHLALITSDDFTGEMADQIQQYVRGEFEAVARRVAIHVFRLSPSDGLVSWLLDRGQWRMMKPPQPESLDTLRRQSKIRIQFWRELRRDLETLGE